MGLAYKPGIGDSRESPSYELIKIIKERGAAIDFHDELAPVTVARRHNFEMKSVALTAESIAAYDAVLISTAHADVDWKQIADHAQLVVDTRNVMSPWSTNLAERLVKA